jgi:hypothetical protein
MKKIRTATLIFISSWAINLSAQDPNYKGPAKMDVNTFWRQAEIVKNGKATSSTLSNLEKAMANIKQKDPSYSTSSMDEIIQTCKEKVSKDKAAESGKKEQHLANMDASRNETQNKIKIKKMFDDVFNIGAFSFPDLEKAQQENDAYKKEVDDLLAMKDERAAYIAEMKKGSEYERFVGKMKISYDRNFDAFIDKVDKIMTQSTGGDDGNWKNVYYEMQAEQIHWDAAQKVFPDEPKFAEANKKITAKVNQYGSLEKIAGKNKENNIEKIKSQKLPAAVIKDATLEKMFIDAFNKRYSLEYKGSATKAIMLQTDWQTERNELTGIVTGRIRQGAVVYNGNDGKCYLVSILHLYQEYIGGSFQNTKAVYAQNGQEMLCENVK